MVNPLGYAASEAAWRDGDPWRQRLIQVLRFNGNFIATIEQIPGISYFTTGTPTLVPLQRVDVFSTTQPAASSTGM